MTLIMGWLACDARGPCSAYIASDSRISNGANHYDNSKKLFALRNTPDILGYCGETMFTNQWLSTITNICDEKRLLSPNMDYEERSKTLFNEIQKNYANYMLNNEFLRIYHVGRDNQFLFQANKYTWNGKIWTNESIETQYDNSKLLFVDGSGKKEYEQRFQKFKNGNNGGTSRNYFHCFCDIMKDMQDKHTGGAPQLTSLYRGKKFNGMYHGIILNERRYYQGQNVDAYCDMSDVQWYNSNFEICDSVTGLRKDGAMRQPISKK